MFNINRSKTDKNANKNKSILDWLQFSSGNKKDGLLDSVISDNKFLQDELEIRNMVEEMLVKEFSESIKNIKEYDFLVDSVVNKLKQQQLGDISEDEEIK
ncbi:hypothetical protein IJ182_11100 [bacterium]|nr:hypothetical protein [bacterium]